MGGSPNYNYPAQPTYGEGMADAMKAQMEMLTGQTLAKDEGFEELYASALGKEGGTLADIMREFEAPLRKQTAQIDTDVMRQTILGGKGKTTDQEGRVITGYTPPEPAGGGSALGGYQIVNLGLTSLPGQDRERSQYGLVDKDGNVVLTAEDDPAEFGMGGNRMWDKGVKTGSGVASLMAQAKKDGLLTPQQAEAGKKAEPIYETDPETGEPIIYKDDDGNVLSGQEIAREGTGMIDLLGDTRGVQEQVGDYSSYLKDNPDLQAAFEAENETLARRRMPQKTEAEWGQEHYESVGKAEGRERGFTLQDAGRQAGFDELGRFRGLSALAEDIGRGGQQRAREADIADVERLGGRATEAYRAQGDLSGALAQARAIGAGGIDMESAIPADNLFGVADPLKSLAARTKAENLGISAISGGRMGDYDPLALAPAPGRVLDHLTQTAPTAPTMTAIQQQPKPVLPTPTSTSAAQRVGGAPQGPVQPGQPALGGAPAAAQPQAAQYAQPGGTDAFRSALMQQGYGALDEGITARENRAIQEAARARATNMGRTFDQTASIKEAEDVIREDNARRMQNRAFAQSALGQEVGIQQADLARGLQAQQMEMARQSAGVDRQLTAEEKDIERAMRRGAMEEQFRQSGLGAERASAAQMVGLEQATSADPFQAILQRQGQNNLGAGGALFGQAGYGLESGPQYLNPEAGLGFISNQATNAANMFNAQQAADATRSAGMFGGLGSIFGELGGAAITKYCWVAREVYGAHNPAWLDFRHWMFSSAPRWFFKLYLTFGERFANFISNKPRLKARIRMWMDSKIGR